jgi:hypothetical protein
LCGSGDGFGGGAWNHFHLLLYCADGNDGLDGNRRVIKANEPVIVRKRPVFVDNQIQENIGWVSLDIEILFYVGYESFMKRGKNLSQIKLSDT